MCAWAFRTGCLTHIPCDSQENHCVLVGESEMLFDGDIKNYLRLNCTDRFLALPEMCSLRVFRVHQDFVMHAGLKEEINE